MSSKKEVYVSPVDQSNMKIVGDFYIDENHNTFPIKNNIPNFIFPRELSKSDLESIEWYKNNASVYDEYLPLTFETFNVNEDVERSKMINLLKIEEDHKILEIGCGTGRDSEKIAKKLGKGGELYLQDISEEILNFAIEKFSKKLFATKIEFSLANGYYLPFKDNYFNRVFHFGGLNTFGNIRRTFNEIIRVTKPGGRVVVGDENMPLWLRDTKFGNILMNSNPHYKYNLPIQYLPVQARNVRIDWIIGGVFYVITFDVGEGEPYANIDFEIPGIRGGTHRTRYYGHLEGVTPEAIELARKAIKQNGKSMHKWLDDAIKKAAIEELGTSNV